MHYFYFMFDFLDNVTFWDFLHGLILVLLCFFLFWGCVFLWDEVTDLKEQNNGKASILRESIRLLKELFSQIESLKKDSASLLSETHYVSSSPLFIQWRFLACV